MTARALFGVCLCAVLMIPAPASAHVGVETDNARPGAEATLKIHVPNESESADTTKVEVQLPEGFTFVEATSNGGWKIAAQGNVVTIDGGKIGPGEDRNFALVVRNAAEAGESTFPAIQTYSDGERVRWIGAPGSDKPAPDLVVEGKPVKARADQQTAPGAAVETTSPDAPTPAESAAPSETISAPPEEPEDEGGTSPALIAVGVIILLGVGASALFRRRNAADED